MSVGYNFIFFSLKMVHIMLGERDFLPSSPMIRRLGKEFCSNDIYKHVCVDLLFLLCGFDYDGLNQVRKTELRAVSGQNDPTLEG